MTAPAAPPPSALTAPNPATDSGAGSATDLSWLLDRFVREIPGLLHAVVVSVDGLLVAMDADCNRDVADQLAAVAAGLNQMCAGAGEAFGAGTLQQQMVQYAAGFIVLRSMARGAVVAAVAQRRCDMSLLGHELATLARSVGDTLSPQLISELRRELRT